MKSYIIHLSRIPSSLETALKVKEQLDAFEMENELFEGSYGNEVRDLFEKTGRNCHPWGFKGPSKLMSEESKQQLSTPGIMGCFFSHYRLWEKCVELNEPIMIFEDDVIFTRKYIPIDWKDILITVFGNPTKSSKYSHFLTDSTGEARAEKYKQASMPGTPGYAIKPDAAKRLIETYQNSFLPSDNAINKNIVEIEVHSHVMGRALLSDDGKKSLVRGKKDFWGKFK